MTRACRCLSCRPATTDARGFTEARAAVSTDDKRAAGADHWCDARQSPILAPRQRLRLVLDEHERERIDLAHELHEQIAQTLAAVLLDLDGLRLDRSEDCCVPDRHRARARGGDARALQSPCRGVAPTAPGPARPRAGSRAPRGACPESMRVHVDPALAGAALGPALQTEVYRVRRRGARRCDGLARAWPSRLIQAGPDLRISLRPLDGANPGQRAGAAGGAARADRRDAERSAAANSSCASRSSAAPRT